MHLLSVSEKMVSDKLTSAHIDLERAILREEHLRNTILRTALDADSMWAFFSKYGKVVRVDRETGRSKVLSLVH